jgi:carbamoyl-phosphate synthase large subunit
MPHLSVDAVNDVGADAVHSQAEEGVLWIAHNAEKLDASTLCPTARVVLLSQDKWEAALQFRRAQLRYDKVSLVQDEGTLRMASRELSYPFWLRARHGAGARGSALCENWGQAIHWAEYWWARDAKYDFIAEEYLPGRDLAWTSLWYRGSLVASFGRERLEYIYPKLAPSGRTGTPTIARTIHDQVLNDAAMRTVKAIDDHPHGFYSADFREDQYGYPCPTEVNAGRCFTTSYLSTAAGYNFMDQWARLIDAETKLGEVGAFEGLPIPVARFNNIPEGLTWMRHIDCPELLLDPQGVPLNLVAMTG